MALYSEKVMDHFTHPRNVGVIENADGVGEVGNAKCGDIMKIYLKIENDIIVDVKFETFGCGSAIASSSMATEMIKGKSINDAMALTNKAVAEALDGLPAHKLHCSVLAEEAIKNALKDYYDRNNNSCLMFFSKPGNLLMTPTTSVASSPAGQQQKRT
jgi:nitrogen fixation NifU-like protein